MQWSIIERVPVTFSNAEDTLGKNINGMAPRRIVDRQTSVASRLVSRRSEMLENAMMILPTQSVLGPDWMGISMDSYYGTMPRLNRDTIRIKGLKY